MDKIINDISKNIKKYRKLNGMTQKELSQKVGVSVAAVSNWETGTNSIDIDSLFKVCDALDVPISVMTDSVTSLELSGIEKDIILKFRSATDWQQMSVLKILDMEGLPPHLLKYHDLFIKKLKS